MPQGEDIGKLIESGVTSEISEEDMLIYLCSAQLIEVDSISKEINCAEHEYMNMSPSLIALATPLLIEWDIFAIFLTQALTTEDTSLQFTPQ